MCFKKKNRTFLEEFGFINLKLNLFRNNLKIYPNPVESLLHLEYSKIIHSIEVFNAWGEGY